MSTPPPVPERQPWLALTALCAGLFITLMDQALVAVALPSIREDLGASINETVWVVAVYLLAFAAPLLVSGRLGDRFGQRNVYLAGMAVFTVAATAAAFAPPPSSFSSRPAPSRAWAPRCSTRSR